MRAICTLSNQWTWSGGFATFLVWARDQTLARPGSDSEGPHARALRTAATNALTSEYACARTRHRWRDIPYPAESIPSAYWDERPMSERPIKTAATWDEYAAGRDSDRAHTTAR